MQTRLRESEDAAEQKEKAEKNAFRAACQLAEREEQVVRRLNYLIGSLKSLQGRYARADSVGITFNNALDVERELSRVHSIQDSWRARATLAHDLCGAAERMVSVAKNWDNLASSKEKIQASLAKAREKVREVRSEIEGASGDRVAKLSKKLRDAEADFEKVRASASRHADEEAKCQANFADLAARRGELLTELAGVEIRVYTLDSSGSRGGATSMLPGEASQHSADVVDIRGSSESAARTPTGEASRDAVGDEILRQIEKLADLHRSGILTAEEFASKKAELLARL
jgi:chromosome segregation ATPase